MRYEEESEREQRELLLLSSFFAGFCLFLFFGFGFWVLCMCMSSNCEIENCTAAIYNKFLVQFITILCLASNKENKKKKQ